MGSSSSEPSVLVSPVCLPTWERWMCMMRRLMSKSSQRRPRISLAQSQQHGDEDHGADVRSQVSLRDEGNPLVAGDDVGWANPLLSAFDPDEPALEWVALHRYQLPLHRAFEQEMQ